jgi:hypothetical protein
MNQRAQVALEFLLFIIIGVMFLLVMISLGARLSAQALEEQGTKEAEELAISIQEELILAAQVQAGYYRILDLPLELRNGEYTITNTEDSITITKNDLTITLKTPATNGTFVKGRNVIRHEQETIIIN